ncbi:MAG: hypothetical protein GF384_06825, partial [Elusimicrobia bacterium]|nr:hypothetical protein [Elusimicrobiota bacterium]
VERRKYLRVDFDLKLTFYKDDTFSHIVPLDGLMTDMTEVGMGFMSSHNFKVGEPVFVKFEITEGLPVKLVGEVFWKRGKTMMPAYGVKFVKMGWLSRRNLERGFVMKFRPHQKSSMLTYLQYFLLVLLIVVLSRFLDKMPLAYTIGIFMAFLGVGYYVAMRRLD